MEVELSVYLSGEIHTEWREEIEKGVEELDLPVDLTGPITDHAASDDCGVAILGKEENSFWKDHKGAKLNAIRTRTLIGDADLVVIRFGDKYRQWNAAFDAGYAAALGTPYIVLHGPDHAHALKEVDAEAFAVCETTEQVVAVLRYLTRGELVRPSPSLSVVR
ncbi:MAG: YtoQ family protein [Pseudomonadota bacterium]